MEPRSVEEIGSMGVRALKEYIEACGGDHSECLEKSDLRDLATKLSEKLASKSPAPKPARRSRAAPAAPAATTTTPSSPPRQAKSRAESSPLSAPNTGGSASGRKKMSVFRAKKFVASKVGDTKMGRATVVKILGESGDVMLQALKSATSTLDSREVAKKLKHDIIKFMLKGYNLWKHKDLTEESTRNCRRPTQIAAERLVMLAENPSIRIELMPTLINELGIMKLEVLNVFSAHIQEKNYQKLDSLLSYYVAEKFISKLLSSASVQGERDELVNAVKDMLAPTESILNTERSKEELSKMRRYVENTLKSPHLVSYVEQPRLAAMLQAFLDHSDSSCPKDSVRFLLAVHDYEKTTSKNLLKVRAPKIFDKYLRGKASNPVFQVCDAAQVEKIDKAIYEQRVGMTLFNKLKNQIIDLMAPDFEDFLKSDVFLNHLKEKENELEELESGRM